MLPCSANGPCRGAGTCLPRTPGHLSATINTEQNLRCWGATPLGTIRLETRLNGAGIVLQATLCAAFEHSINPAPAAKRCNCARSSWLHPEGFPCQPLPLNDLEAELFECENVYING